MLVHSYSLTLQAEGISTIDTNFADIGLLVRWEKKHHSQITLVLLQYSITRVRPISGKTEREKETLTVNSTPGFGVFQLGESTFTLIS